MALVELGQTKGDVQNLFPRAEVAEPTFLFPQDAAKTLATEFLLNRPNELRLKREILHSEDSYMKGRMDTRAMVLTMIGQAHILALDLSNVDPHKPPMIDIKPLNLPQIDILLKSYENARKYLIDHNFAGKPIGKISIEEAYSWGQMKELGRNLIYLGQKEKLDAIDGTPQSHIQNNGNSAGELQ